MEIKVVKILDTNICEMIMESFNNRGYDLGGSDTELAFFMQKGIFKSVFQYIENSKDKNILLEIRDDKDEFIAAIRQINTNIVESDFSYEIIFDFKTFEKLNVQGLSLVKDTSFKHLTRKTLYDDFRVSILPFEYDTITEISIIETFNNIKKYTSNNPNDIIYYDKVIKLELIDKVEVWSLSISENSIMLIQQK